MRVWIDREGCISCGQCAETCPKVFDICEDGLADVIQQPDEELEDMAQAAADGCPVSVIHTEQ
ncbi:MAG: ferredoxin [Clostridia bacterium]|nr:ferredoxin [Clostridia bacterium]